MVLEPLEGEKIRVDGDSALTSATNARFQNERTSMFLAFSSRYSTCKTSSSNFCWLMSQNHWSEVERKESYYDNMTETRERYLLVSRHSSFTDGDHLVRSIFELRTILELC